MIADFEDVTVERSSRLATAMQAAVMHPRPRPIRLDTIHAPERRPLQVVVVGEANDVASILQTLNALVEAFR